VQTPGQGLANRALSAPGGPIDRDRLGSHSFSFS
jgi:hypothetical protein